MGREDNTYVMSEALDTASTGLPEPLINCLPWMALFSFLPAGRQLIRREREREEKRKKDVEEGGEMFRDFLWIVKPELLVEGLDSAPFLLLTSHHIRSCLLHLVAPAVNQPQLIAYLLCTRHCARHWAYCDEQIVNVQFSNEYKCTSSKEPTYQCRRHERHGFPSLGWEDPLE